MVPGRPGGDERRIRDPGGDPRRSAHPHRARRHETTHGMGRPARCRPERRGDRTRRVSCTCATTAASGGTRSPTACGSRRTRQPGRCSHRTTRPARSTASTSTRERSPPIYTQCDGANLRGPNDLVFDSAGGFWFTDMGKTRPGVQDYGAVYYAQPDGSSITRVPGNFNMANGIGLSPDESVLYVSETTGGHVWAIELAGPGVISDAQRDPLHREPPGTMPRQQHRLLRFTRRPGRRPAGRRRVGRRAVHRRTRRQWPPIRGVRRPDGDEHRVRRARPDDGVRHAVRHRTPRRRRVGHARGCRLAYGA